MLLNFTKMHGLGNDFIVIDATQNPFNLNTAQIQKLGNRHLGIGFDQLLIIEKSPDPTKYDFAYRIFNNDGSEVGNCGNGARCFAKYVYEKKLTNKKQLQIATQKSTMLLSILDNGLIQVNMGQPQFDPKTLPLQSEATQTLYELEGIQFGAVSLGNPHAVITVPHLELNIEPIAQILQTHPAFSESVNVGFMEIVDASHINLRVYERGAGETQACGTGACAAVAVGIQQNLLTSPVRVKLAGGNLDIIWETPNEPLFMIGEASFVFEGSIEI